MKQVLALLIFVLGIQLTTAAAPDDILGIWFNEEKDAKIEIYEKNGKFFGKIVWHSTGDDVDPYDSENPDPELRKRKKMGMVVLKDFEYDDGEYEEGTIYDPKNGKTYDCIMKLQDDGSLYVRGYIGFSLLGRTTYWTRPE
ncbi:MAG TPA: DUF2147 domain-containing protein [Cytophagales bacterium]|jgi:uncharacterized protein (DUF2147 family)|nr:DUF2147 domain-containing protein [Cytophagales bacterium]